LFTQFVVEAAQAVISV